MSFQENPNMPKRTLPFILLFFFVLCLPVRAQEASWTAWLYNAGDGRMTHVNADGAVLDDFVLPMPPGFDSYPQKVAVGHGGSPFAYIVFNGVTFQGALVITQDDQLQFTANLPLTFSDSTEFVADETIFNEDNSALALGYSLDGGGWAVNIFDIRSGAFTQTVRHDSPLVAVLGLDSGFGLTPVPRRFIGRDVTFTMIQSGTEGAAEYDSYTWNINSGNLTKNLMFPSLGIDTLSATGEMVMSLPDERLPNDNTAFTFFQANTLHVYEPVSGARFPFFNAPNLTLSQPHFIQNGELILVDSVDAAGRFQWLIVGRDGIPTGTLPTSVTINDLRGVGDGFIYTTNTFDPGAATLVYVNTRDGLDAGVPIWTSTSGTFPTIAWTGDMAIRAQATYTPWAKLADAVYAPGVTAQIAPVAGQPLLTPGAVSAGDIAPSTPVFGRFLTVGGIATVNTTEGDQLNVRLGPGTSNEIIARLEDGERVTLLEGPRTAEGFTWWKIRTAAGIEGWVVESVDENGTHLQTLIPG
jgi:hypothetical protein